MCMCLSCVCVRTSVCGWVYVRVCVCECVSSYHPIHMKAHTVQNDHCYSTVFAELFVHLSLNPNDPPPPSLLLNILKAVDIMILSSSHLK